MFKFKFISIMTCFFYQFRLNISFERILHGFYKWKMSLHLSFFISSICRPRDPHWDLMTTVNI